jgi:hypothetical protein
LPRLACCDWAGLQGVSLSPGSLLQARSLAAAAQGGARSRPDLGRRGLFSMGVPPWWVPPQRGGEGSLLLVIPPWWGAPSQANNWLLHGGCRHPPSPLHPSASCSLPQIPNR